MLRDPDFGAVRVRGYGTYSFRVKDPYVFMTELSGSHSTYRTEDISDHIRSMLVMAISDALGESGISVVDMAANLMELSDAVKASLEKRFSELGLELSDFNFENVSLPAELEKAMEDVYKRQEYGSFKIKLITASTKRTKVPQITHKNDALIQPLALT